MVANPYNLDAATATTKPYHIHDSTASATIVCAGVFLLPLRILLRGKCILYRPGRGGSHLDPFPLPRPPQDYRVLRRYWKAAVTTANGTRRFGRRRTSRDRTTQAWVKRILVPGHRLPRLEITMLDLAGSGHVQLRPPRKMLTICVLRVGGFERSEILPTPCAESPYVRVQQEPDTYSSHRSQVGDCIVLVCEPRGVDNCASMGQLRGASASRLQVQAQTPQLPIPWRGMEASVEKSRGKANMVE